MLIKVTDKKTNNMAISNHTIVALSILTRRAKKSLGTYKTTDILNDPKLAFELITKAILSNDHALSSLAVELNKSLKIEPNLIHALETYVAHLNSKNLKPDFIKKRLICLNQFVPHLEQIELDSTAYRQAASHYLHEVNAADYTFCISLIRNFYPYWTIKDIAFAEVNNEQALDFQSKNLKQLWSSLDQALLTDAEESLVTNYSNAIKAINIKDEELDLRVKIAKLITVKQQNYEKTANGYRKNIDQLKSYFVNDHLLDYFLSVVREFYSQWSRIYESNREPNSLTLH